MGKLKLGLEKKIASLLHCYELQDFMKLSGYLLRLPAGLRLGACYLVAKTRGAGMLHDT